MFSLGGVDRQRKSQIFLAPKVRKASGFSQGNLQLKLVLTSSFGLAGGEGKTVMYPGFLALQRSEM